MDTQEARIFAAIIISVIVIGGIFFYFALSIIRQQRRNLELQNAITLVELSTMEKERARIANDLHDELSPVLSVVKFQVEHVEVLDPEDREQLKKASGYLDNMIQLVREISNNLMPSTLIRKGLVPALEEFINRVTESGRLKIKFTYPVTLMLSEQMSINIYRSIQELIHNALRHAGAEYMEITIEVKKGLLTILCKDNGKGFDYPMLSKETEGLGLNSLKNRATLMGGTMLVESKMNKGSAFLFEIPLN